MTGFAIDTFATACEQAMADAADRETAAKDCLETLLRENDPAEIIAVLEAAIPAGADVGEMIVYCSEQLTLLYARMPARFQSGIHNHTVFACIGQLQGSEISTLYARTADGDGLAVTGTLCADAGEVISLPADAIHHIENPDARTARSLHLYGGDFRAVMSERSLWDSDNHKETVFSFEGLLRESIRSMRAQENCTGLEAVARAIPATRAFIDA